MLRRFFLAATGALMARLAVAQPAAKADTRVVKLLLLDQSGHFGHEHFIFASWLINDEVAMRKRISSLRQASRYRRRLWYGSGDKFKRRFAERVLQNFVVGRGASTRLVSFEPKPQLGTRPM
jgi:hypothetical protein